MTRQCPKCEGAIVVADDIAEDLARDGGGEDDIETRCLKCKTALTVRVMVDVYTWVEIGTGCPEAASGRHDWVHAGPPHIPELLYQICARCGMCDGDEAPPGVPPQLVPMVQMYETIVSPLLCDGGE